MNFVNPNGAISNKITGDQISTISKEQNNYENDPLNHSRLGTGLAVAMIEMGEKILARRQELDKRPLYMAFKESIS